MPDPLNEHEDPRNYGCYVGRVVENEDPKGIGRVRVVIPGFIEPKSSWALPANTGWGGGAQSGAFAPPAVDSSVVVMFLQGDVDHPVYMGGYFGSDVTRDATQSELDAGSQPRVSDTEVPTPVKDLPPEDRPKIRAIETKNFYVYIDERPGEEEDPESGKDRLLIQYKDDDEVFIEIDGVNKGIQVSATAAVSIRSSGIVSIEGSQVQIQGRIVNGITTKEI